MAQSDRSMKDCDQAFILSAKEATALVEIISQNPHKGIRIGQFGCAIGSGYVAEIDGKCFDITDYESW